MDESTDAEPMNIDLKTNAQEVLCKLRRHHPKQKKFLNDVDLNEPEIHRIFVLYIFEVKYRFPFLDQETSVVPQLITSWLGRKNSSYARVTQPKNTPDPKGSCIQCGRSSKRILDSDTSRYLER